MHKLSLGTVPAARWIATGDHWNEITPQSSFIRRPGPLLGSVQRWLRVVTDERGSCRGTDARGKCQEQGLLAATPPERRAALERLLTDLYST